MNNLQICFRHNFIRSYEDSNFQSYRSLSHAAGTSSSRVQKIVNGHFDDSNVGPGIFTIDRMCRQMRVTPNMLLGYDQKDAPQTSTDRAGMPTIERLTSIYMASNRSLPAFAEFERFLQIYGEPTGDRISLIRSGELSLASRAAGTKDVAFLQNQYFLFANDTKEAIYRGQRHAWDNGIGLEVLKLNHDMPEQGRKAKFNFLRLALRLNQPRGEDVLAVYCELVV